MFVLLVSFPAFDLSLPVWIAIMYALRLTVDIYVVRILYDVRLPVSRRECRTSLNSRSFVSFLFFSFQPRPPRSSRTTPTVLERSYMTDRSQANAKSSSCVRWRLSGYVSVEKAVHVRLVDFRSPFRPSRATVSKWARIVCERRVKIMPVSFVVP